MGRSIEGIDLHAHTIIAEVETLVRQQEGWQREVAERSRTVGSQSLEHNRQRFDDTYRERFFNAATRLGEMDAMGIATQVVSITPSFSYNYWAERELADRIVTLTNAGIAQFCAQKPDRFIGLGTVSLQHPELVSDQLERALNEYHLKGAIVSTNVNGTDLAAQALEPFWEAAQRLGALVFIHPIGCALEMRLAPYYLSNLLGNPLETALTLSHLVFGGVLDRYPKLKILAAHGGGFLPFYSARFDHGWRVRPEAHTCLHPPSTYLRRIWFDSLVFDAGQLGTLIQAAGASQIVIGTDYPMDMGSAEPLTTLEKVAGLSRQDMDAIASGNARRLLGL